MVVVKLLLLPQVFVLGRLETHGDELCTGQHLAVFLAPFLLGRRSCAVVCLLERLPLSVRMVDDGDVGPVIQSG